MLLGRMWRHCQFDSGLRARERIQRRCAVKKTTAVMDYRGHVVARPITPNQELSQPLEDYFPHQDPDRWFAWSEAEQNTWIKGRLKGACPIFGYPDYQGGETLEAHHIVRKGTGSKDLAKVPWAIIPALKSPNHDRSAHDLYHEYTLHSQGFEVVKWDWLDEENGFEVTDEEGELIPHEKLFFYNRATTGRVSEAMEWENLMLEANARHVQALYALGVLMAAGEGHAKLLGYSSVKDWMAQHGMMIRLPRMAQKLFEAFHEEWDRLEKGLVPVEMADLVRKKTRKESLEVREDWIDKLLAYCSPLANQPSISDFITLIAEAFPGRTNEKKATVVRGDNLQVAPYRVLDYGELLGGGIVIRGWPINTDEPVN